MATTPHPTTSGATVPTPPVFAGAEAETARGAAETVAARDATWPNNPGERPTHLENDAAATNRGAAEALAAQAALQGKGTRIADAIPDAGLPSVAERKRLRNAR
jgi:hypothetical protein